MTYSISSKAASRTLLTIIAVLIAAHVAVTVAATEFGHDHLMGMGKFLDVNQESSLPTWYSIVQLATAAGLLSLIAAAKRRKGDRFAWYWLVLSLGFFYLSLDEGAVLHERTERYMSQLVASLGAALHFAWVLLAGSAAVTALVLFIPFLRSLPPTFRRRFLFAGICFLGGALGVESTAGWLYGDSANMRTLGERLLQGLEEGMEMSGIALFIAALLGYIASEMGAIAVRFGAEPAPRLVRDPERVRSAARLRAI